MILFARFVVVLRQFNGIVAGTLEMPWWRFVALNAAGAALWTGFWGGLAYMLGKRFYKLLHHFNEYRPYILVAIGVLIVIGVAAFLIWRSRRGKKV